MAETTLLLVCDDRRARGELCEGIEASGARVEEASSRYDLGEIVREEGCFGAFVALSGLKVELDELLQTAATECPGLPIVVVGPGASVADLTAMLRARVVVDYIETVDLDVVEAAVERIRAEGSRPGATSGAAAEPDDGRSPIERMVASIQDGSFQLPALGETMARLRALGDSEEAAISDVEELVGADAALVGAVLKEANSSLLGGRNAVTSLKAACMRMGIPRVLALAREALVASVLPTQGDVAAIAMAAWDRGLLSRRIAEGLAAETGLEPAAVADSMLLHDVGALALLKVLADVLGARSITDEERAQADRILVQNHEAVGAMILKSWGMPIEIVRLAGCHHAAAPRWPETRSQTKLRELVKLTDHAAAWTLGEREDEPSADLLRAAGLRAERVVEVAMRALQSLEAAA